jgi:hypothetical protein
LRLNYSIAPLTSQVLCVQTEEEEEEKREEEAKEEK